MAIDQQLAQPEGKFPSHITYDKTKTINIDFDILKENHIIAGFEPEPFSNVYKILRAQVLQELKSNGWNSIGITSARKGEGKTVTAINLAISLSMDINHTVLLVDANLRNPAIAGYFGIQTKYGLTDCLIDGIEMEDVLFHPSGIERLVILPGGTPLINAGEMLASPMMAEFIREVKTRYSSRIIIFDLPPVLVAGESLAVASYIDTSLLVVEAGKTKKSETASAEALLSSANLLGTVLSKSREKMQMGLF